MKRDEFISQLSLALVAVYAGDCLSSCKKEDTGLPKQVDFTISLTDSAFAELQQDGGFAYKEGVMIGRFSSSEYFALAQPCTHRGTTVVYEHHLNRVHCPNHGSNFDRAGKVLNGPAAMALQMFKTELKGDMLRVFS